MTTIYFKKHSNRKSEKVFFNYLMSLYSDIIHVDENYLLDSHYIDKHISTTRILKFINKSTFISDKKKAIAFEVLSKLPQNIKVAKEISDLSIDYVIKDKNHLTFIEFHEKQHYRLSDYRLRPIFTTDNERREIPRFLQRLMRDIWRWENLRNFKIVWHNWFDKNQKTLVKFHKDQNEEFVLPNKFSISDG
ncbi:MAG: hypothetical protein QM726_12430 [Chitinophagaceae bacterium]